MPNSSLKLARYCKDRSKSKDSLAAVWEIKALPGVVVTSTTKRKWFVAAAPDMWYIEDAASLDQKEWDEMLAAHGFDSLQQYAKSWDVIDAFRNQCFATRRDALQAVAALLLVGLAD